MALAGLDGIRPAQSVALVPLSAGAAQGLLAIASPDADHFNPGMGTDYLARIGELIAAALDAAAERTP